MSLTLLNFLVLITTQKNFQYVDKAQSSSIMADTPVVPMRDFLQKLKDQGRGDSDHLQATAALALLLIGEANADDTAKSITMIYEVDLKRNNGSTYGDGHNKFFHFLNSHICTAIRTFGSAEVQHRLIDLLVEISRQPDVKTPDGSVKLHDAHEVYWRDVPGWEYNFADEILCKSLTFLGYNILLTLMV